VRLITYEEFGEWRTGLLFGDRVVDAAAAAARAGVADERDWTSARQLLAAADAARGGVEAAAGVLAAEERVLSLVDLTLGPPVPDPDKIICLGLNYHEHARESGLSVPAAPMVFAKYRNSLVGPGADIELPRASGQVDYEAELAVVIGRRTKGASPDEALAAVAGVMAFNDLTARDLQHQTSQWTTGKAVDGFAPCGPALVSVDEVGDPQRLRLTARVNGRTVQDGNTADMIFSVAETIAFLARTMTLEPGDIIATGTPPGVGVSRDPQLLLRDGDVVEVELEGVGMLRNRMVTRVLAARS
jgi:2-keto-4-pentenoate hydratase/2-oxohepta-3-ene-1,7-dioic acid hydratase in catechol pathway